MSQAIRLGGACRKIGSGATPRGGKSAYLDTGPFSLIRSQNVLNEGFSHAGLAFISHEQARALDGVAVVEGDVLLNITGDSVARVCQVDSAVLPARVNQHVAIIRPDPRVLDARFLRYVLVSPALQDMLLGLAMAGATRNALTKQMIEDLRLECPPLPEQHAIAATLGALDDKIELNRRTCATLEAMARALFRSWFVDFDPVHAKAAGEAPAHMDPANAALFPDRLSEDGLPEGWRMAPLSSLCAQGKDSIDPRKHVAETFDHYSLPAYDTGNGPVRETGSAIQSQKLVVPSEAILFSRLNPTIPRIWWARTSDQVFASVASTEFLVAVARRKADMPFLYSLMVADEFRGEVIARITGTSNSHQRVKPTSVLEIETVAATPEVRAAFGKLTSPWFDLIKAAKTENRTLATLRDTLLPKLMSGELRVRDAEALTAEVA